MISGQFDVDNGRPQKRELQRLELLPIDNMRFEIDVELAHEIRDIRDGELGIPAVVYMHGEWPQSLLLRQAESVGAVDAAAQTDDAIVMAPQSGVPNIVEEPLKALPPRRRRILLLRAEGIVLAAEVQRPPESRKSPAHLRLGRSGHRPEDSPRSPSFDLSIRTPENLYRYGSFWSSRRTARTHAPTQNAPHAQSSAP